MENRFTFKDFVQILLLAIIAVLIWIMLVRGERQWDQLVRLNKAIEAQTNDLTSLRRLVAEGGVRISHGDGLQNGVAAIGGDVFRRARMVSERPDFSAGDWMVQAFSTAPPKLNYLTSHDLYARVIHMKVLEPLATFDIETLEMVPHIAKDWQMSADGLSLDVQLRTNVLFSDGKPLDADDVVYTWGLFKNPDVTDGHEREYIRHIKLVEKTGTHAVRFYFENIFYENLIRAMEKLVMPKHFFERFSTREIREHPALLLGTGPYRLRDPEVYTPGQPIELVRNERYWGVQGPWDRMIWQIIEKESAELITFRNGETDLFVPTPEQHVEMLKDADLLGRTRHYVYEHVRIGYSYIAWNQRRGGKPTIFADKRVRQAMTMLIDRQRLIDEIWLGFGTVASGPFNHLGEQYNKDIERWPHDPSCAIEQLREVGFSREGEGVMHRPDGEPFEIKLTYPSGSDLVQKIALFLKDNFARAGINLELDPQKWALMLKTLTEKNFDAITLAWGGGGLESDIEQMFHTRTIKEGDNRNAYSNPELDRLIEKAHVTLDKQERTAIWKKCHAILHEDQPYTFMVRGRVRLWLDHRIQNVRRIPVLGINSISTWPVPIEWYVPRQLQKHGTE